MNCKILSSQYNIVVLSLFLYIQEKEEKVQCKRVHSVIHHVKKFYSQSNAFLMSNLIKVEISDNYFILNFPIIICDMKPKSTSFKDYIHCKNSFLITVQNKADIDRGIRTKNSNLASQSYSNMLYSVRYCDLLYSANYFLGCIINTDFLGQIVRGKRKNNLRRREI